MIEAKAMGAMSDIPSLSVLIPSYKRALYLEVLLRTLVAEPAVAAGHVPIVVSDDQSPDHSADIVRWLQRELPGVDLRLHMQERNRGAVGNIQWLAEGADTDYVWIIGNDDRPVAGAIDEILRHLASMRPAVLHLPHSFPLPDNPNPILSPMPDATQILPSGRELLLEYSHWLRFVSASVVHREALQRAVAECPTRNELAPWIWFTVAGREGPCVVLDKRLVLGTSDVPLWESMRASIYTTDHVTAFDDGIHLMMNETDFGSVLDRCYQAGGLDNWSRDQLSELSDAVRRFPRSRLLRKRLTELARDAQDQSGLAVADEAARASGDAELAAQFLAASEVQFAAGDFNQALMSSTIASEIHPTSPATYCNVGVIRDALNDEFAIRFFNIALRVAPTDHDALLNRASWAFNRGLLGQAVHDARCALESDPSSVEARLLLDAASAQSIAA
jgi:glycosyltransferase involved in cell wall biosynthesis